MRCAAWQAYTSTASWHRDPHASGTDPSATVVHSYPSPGRIAEHMAGPGHNADAPRRLEIARRLLRHAHAAVLAETLGLASRLGMEVRDVLRALAEGPGGSWVLDAMGEAMRRLRAGERLADVDVRSPDRGLERAVSRTRRDRTTVAAALDELSSVLDVANSIPLATPVAGAAQQVFVLGAAQGLGDEDEVA
jgi:3-hydroxyisobutyrate dehydrogenase